MPISSDGSRTSLRQAVKVSLTKPIYRFETGGRDVRSRQGQQLPSDSILMAVVSAERFSHVEKRQRALRHQIVLTLGAQINE
jgi:hypothetical protein